MYSYSATQWLLVFYVYCFLGWCFESAVVSVQQRRFVNRGFLRGPMLPIYGFGATILLHVALPLYHHPFWLFLASMAAATVFEYIVGVAMERIFKVKYWDYTHHRFQFRGYICLQSSVCWGVLGLLLAHVIHPPVETLVAWLPGFGLIALDILLSAAFVSDVAVSVRTALDLAKILEELDNLREQAVELRGQLSETALVGLTKLSYRVDEVRGELSEKIDEARSGLEERAIEAREQLEERVDDTRGQLTDAKEQLLTRMEELQHRFDERAAGLQRTRKSLLRGNPSARSAQYDDVLQRLKRRIDAHKPR